MALTQNDQVVLIQSGLVQQDVPFGVVITAGANPVISWDGQPSVTYSALAAPFGVLRTAVASLVDFALWFGVKVMPNPNAVNPVPNPSGRTVGKVVQVLLAGDPPATLYLLVKLEDGSGYMFLPAALMQALPLT